jgi:hypothetical protein
MSRLTADMWVSAYLRRLSMINIPAFITAKGDATAGAVLVKLSTLDGQACAYQRSFDLMSDERVWVVLAEGADAQVEAALEKQKSVDPDIWVIEVEDRDGRHLLDEPGLAE